VLRFRIRARPRRARRAHPCYSRTAGTACHERPGRRPGRSTHVAQRRRHGALINAARPCAGTNAGAASLDAVSPTECRRTMSDGQAGDLELNAVDGGGGVHYERGGGVN
jgi:hypothetical protein